MPYTINNLFINSFQIFLTGKTKHDPFLLHYCFGQSPTSCSLRQDLVYVLRSKFKSAFSYFNGQISGKKKKKWSSCSRVAMIQMVALPLIQIETFLVVDLMKITSSRKPSAFLYKEFLKDNTQHVQLQLKVPVLYHICIPISYPLKLTENLINERLILPAYTHTLRNTYLTRLHKLIPKQQMSKKKVHFRFFIAQLIQSFGLCSAASLTGLLLNTGLGGTVVCSDMSSECLNVISF